MRFGANFERDGFALCAHDAKIAAWAEAANAVADAILADPVEQNTWLRHGKTWFVGVDSLPNEANGAVRGVPLAGGVIEALQAIPELWPSTLHRAQLSVCYPGYPLQDPDESDANHGFRRNRDAAHLDGLLLEGPERRRYLKEPHGVILGLPLNQIDPKASPLVVWRGSHHIIAKAFRAALEGHASETWAEIDVTDIYQAARREVFETCERVELPGQPGEASVLHRHVIHGVAPWEEGVPGQDRRIAYFRPHLKDYAQWLALP
ncbi:MAG: hypothetical protein AAGD04_12160 [Pseudomonadota bacterium]